jgi:hypothetical protein
MQIFYCIFIPEIRRERALSFLLSLPITGLWIGALKLSWPSQAALVLPALMLESLSSLLVSLPVGDRFRGGEPERVIDPDKDIARLQGFFTLIIGEGVFGLIVGNDSGLGFGDKVVLSVEALIIYYVVFTLFFLGDSSKTYIHALFRNRYTAAAFES